MRIARLALTAILLASLPAPSAAAGTDETVVARVGDRNVTLKEVNEAIAKYMPHIGRSNLLSASQMREFIEGFLHRVAVERLVKREGRAEKLRQSPEGGMVRTSFLVERLFRSIGESITFTDAELEEAMKKEEYRRFQGPDQKAQVESMERERLLKEKIDALKDEYLKAHPLDTDETAFARLASSEAELSPADLDRPLLRTVDGDLSMTIRDFLLFTRFYGLPVPVNELPAADRREIALNGFSREIMVREARKRGFEKEADFEPTLEKELADRSVSDVYRGVDESVKEVEVPEAKLRAHYEAEKARGVFDRPGEIKASHILVDASEEVLIKALRAELVAGGDFEKLAKQYSKCPSKERGGDLGYFPRGQMVKEFDDAAHALKPGEISKPVKTQFGWHLIKRTGERPGETMSFEAVKERLKTILSEQARNEAVKEKLRTLVAGDTMEVFFDRIPREMYVPDLPGEGEKGRK